METDGTIGDGVLIANNVGIIGSTGHDLHEIGVPISRARWVGEHPNELGIPVSIGLTCGPASAPLSSAELRWETALSWPQAPR